MAEETQAKPAEEVVAVPPASEETAASAQKEEPAGESAPVVMEQSISFKEESNVVADLEDPEKKALDELKQLIQAALAANEFAPPPPPPPPVVPKEEEVKPEEPAEVVVTEKTVAVVEEKTVEAIEETVVPAVASSAEDPAAPIAVEEKTVEAIEETIVSVAAPASIDKIDANPDPAPEPAEGASAPAPAPAPASAPVITGTEPEEVFIWGIPLVGDEKSDTVLLKFLRARDFKAKDALAMIKNTVIWRKTFGIESLLDEDLEFPEMEKVVFMHGFDKEGHPVCYNVYGEFQDKELYAKAFGDDEKRMKFLKWRIQFLEKGIKQQLDFSPGGVCTMVQVTDLKNSPGPGKRELRQATNQALALLQDNYPEFVAKQV